MSEQHSTAGHKATATKRATLIVVTALGFGLVFDYLFFQKLPGISFPIYIALALAAIFSMARYSKINMPRSAHWIAALMLFFSSMLFVRAGGLISFINIVVCLYLLALLLRVIFKPGLRYYKSVEYFKLIKQVPLRGIRKLKGTIQDLSIAREFIAKHESAPQVVRGILIAVPVLALFAILFSSADIVFRKYASNLFSFHINGTIVGWIFWGLLIAFIFAGIFSYLQKSTEDKMDIKDVKVAKKPVHFGLTETVILLGSLNVLFFSFIAIQIRYLFGGQNNITVQGFTYAEYARKGFFELLAVAAISYLLILAIEKMLQRKGEKHTAQFRVLSAMLIAQVAIIMVSAFKRMGLYESAYGFTSLRLYVQIIIVWLAVVFGILLYKIFKDQRENIFAFLTFASIISLLIFINGFNVDGFVARKNIDRYHATGKIDVAYLGELSDDAVVQTAQLLDERDLKVRGNTAKFLQQKQQDLQQKDKHWQSTNLMRKAGLRALNERSF